MKTYRVVPSQHAMSHIPYSVEADRIWLGDADEWVFFYINLGRFRGEARVFAVRSRYVEHITWE